MPRFSSRSAVAIFICMVVGFGALVVRVAYLQTYFRQKHILRTEQQQHTRSMIPARRGSLFDRNGHPLATTIQSYTIYVDPFFLLKAYQSEGRSLNDMDLDLAKLGKLIDREGDELAALVGSRFEDRFVRIAEAKDERTAEEVRKLGIPGVGLEPVGVRHYPMGSLAAHVLGAVGGEGHGLEGIELAADKLLAGRNGYKRIEKDARRRPIGITADDYVPPVHGRHIVLTLDSNIQMIAEQELQFTCTEYKAESGEVIVLDPHTGDILAMASYPTFEPQSIEDSAPEARINRCIVMPYEPGSTFKPFIAGPALMWRQTRLDERWAIPNGGYTTPYGRRVSDVHYYGGLVTWDVLVKSSNIGMAMLSERLGNTRLHRALGLFEFGQRTGIELPGEDQGRVNDLRRWTRYSTESVAQGYEVMVTPLQMARAFCAYANGGRLVKPRVVRGQLDAEGGIIEQHAPPRLDELPQAIDQETSESVRRVLADVVVRGTAVKARSKAWNLFGKTGTSHISQGRAGYADGLYNSSFMGGGPLENPRVVVTMVIHKPDRRLGHYGGTVSAPAAARVLERTLAYLQVPPSPPLAPPPPHVAALLYNYNAALYGEQTASR